MSKIEDLQIKYNLELLSNVDCVTSEFAEKFLKPLNETSYPVMTYALGFIGLSFAEIACKRMIEDIASLVRDDVFKVRQWLIIEEDEDKKNKYRVSIRGAIMPRPENPA